jgi:hypothetical protein
MFTNRVANIGPGETVLIEIEYQAPVTVRGGDYALHLPLVVGRATCRRTRWTARPPSPTRRR